MNDYVSSRLEPSMEPFSRAKRYVPVGPWEVAYAESGSGPPLVLLHGCPFQAYEWSRVIPLLAPRFRVLAPDLLGLGDTRVHLTDDYSLAQQVSMIVGFMDALGLPQALFVGHDHGAAVLQLMMQQHPERISKAVLTNAEAYDRWPSREERPYIVAVVNGITTGLVRAALSVGWLRRVIFKSAVADPRSLTDEVLRAFARPHTATARRWQRLRRFFRGQLDSRNNQETLHALDGMRRFDRPTLLLWGKLDPHFGTAIAERLARDIPGTAEVRYLERSAHLPMLEEPQVYADALLTFLG